MTAPTMRQLVDIGEKVASADEDIRGRDVLDSDGKTVGIIDGLMVDDHLNKVRFLRIAHGGFIGLGVSHMMIPVDAITAITDKTVTIDRGREHLQGAPGYDPSLISAYDQQYWESVSGFYGYSSMWGVGYVYPPYPNYRR